MHETTPRVLVIDDDDDLRELMKTMLEYSGFEVETASDGIDALDPGPGWAAIVLDVKMPIFDGGKLTDYWAMTNPELLRRSIVLSGYSRLASATDRPVFRRLRKPFTEEELVTTVRECAKAAEEERREDAACGEPAGCTEA